MKEIIVLVNSKYKGSWLEMKLLPLTNAVGKVGQRNLQLFSSDEFKGSGDGTPSTDSTPTQTVKVNHVRLDAEGNLISVKGGHIPIETVPDGQLRLGMVRNNVTLPYNFLLSLIAHNIRTARQGVPLIEVISRDEIVSALQNGIEFTAN